MQLLSNVTDTAFYESPVSAVFGNSAQFTACCVFALGNADTGAGALLNCFNDGDNTGWSMGYAIAATGAATLSVVAGDGVSVLPVATVSPYQFLGRMVFLAMTVSPTRVSIYVNGQIAAAADFVPSYSGTTANGLTIGTSDPVSDAAGRRFFGAAFETTALSPGQILEAWEALSQSEQLVRSVDFEGGMAEFDFAWDVPTGLQNPGSNLAADVWTTRAGGVDLAFGGGGAQQPLIVYPNPVWA